MRCWFCGRPVIQCSACGIGCLCEQGPLCWRCVDDDDLVSPEEMAWLEGHGRAWRPVFAPGPGRGRQMALF